MEYKIFESKDFPGEWVVGEVDGEGKIYLARFSGPRARERAEEYQVCRAAAGAY